MTDQIANTERIAKNTLMLYFRMFFLMILGLFTSRIVLQALGENDFGIYNVVGGVVAMFTVISGALTTAVTRFITYEMGKGEEGQLGKVYSTAVVVQFVLAVIVVSLAEPAGLWFIENKMTIDPGKISAAKWVLQFSLLSFAVNLMSVPQMALITAHEKMSAYAAIGVLDGILKFAIALLIGRTASAGLVTYAALMAVAVVIVRAAYGIYCRYNFPECRFSPVFERGLIKEMFSFSGWNFIGAASGVLRDHGGNILVNVFFQTTVNAARGVAVQLSGVIQSFVSNFMTAVNPQITKSYASGDVDYMHSLLRRSSRMSFYLLLLLSVPVFFNVDWVLSIWLSEVPRHTALFVQLFIVYNLCESVSHPLVTAMLATGDIRNYQIVVGGLQMMNLPVSYLCLKMGAPPESTVVVAIVISQICLAARLVMLRKMISLDVGLFLTGVYLNAVKVAGFATLASYIVVKFMPEGNWFSALSFVLCLIVAGASCLFLGCSTKERLEVLSIVKKMTGR